MSHVLYASEYIHRAISQDRIETPDLSKANGAGEILISIYDAHCNGGPAGARVAWEMVKRLRPDVVLLETAGSLLIHSSELKYLSKPEVQLEGYPFYRYGLNLLVGQSGAGKSFVALDYGGHVAQEKSVVYIVGEGLHGYAARWEAWKDFNKCHDGKMYFYKEPVQLIDEVARNTFIELVGPKQPELVIIDTFARCAVGIEENSAKEVGVFVEACDQMRRDLNCGVLVVHHTGKDGKLRGSSALYAACDAVLMQVKVDGRIALANNADAGGKNKHDQESNTRYLKIVPWVVSEYEGAVLMEAEQVVERPEYGLSSNQRTVLEVIEGHDKGIAPKNIMEATGLKSSSLFHALKQLLKAKFVEQTDDDRYVITDSGYAALTGLQ